MIEPAWAMLAATAVIAAGDWCNRHWFGWMPDDPPSEGRKQHLRPMPLAGVLLVPVILPWCVADAAYSTAAAIVIAAAVGFLDDRRKERGNGLDWRIKAVGLVIAAALVASATIATLDHDTLGQEPLGHIALWCTAFGLTFVLTNAVNFLDNTDGVAAGLGATMLLGLATAMAGLGPDCPDWVLAAGFASLGFLPWNWPRPWLYLGDAGAYTLGIATSQAVVLGMREDPGVLWFAAVPLADFVQVVTARVWLQLPPWVGDRRHLTHIAHNLGLPRLAVAPLFALLAWAVARAATAA